MNATQPALLPAEPYTGDASATENRASPIHRWVPWIAGFSGAFVRDVIDSYLPDNRRAEALVLDPFAGVGTTLVETLKAGCNCAGYEINPFAALAARVKINCLELNATVLEGRIRTLETSLRAFEATVDGLWARGGDRAVTAAYKDLQNLAPVDFRSRIPFFSPPVEVKVLWTLRHIAGLPEPDRLAFKLALGAQMVAISNYTYEPSLSSRPGAGKPTIPNAALHPVLCGKLREMVEDADWAQRHFQKVWAPRRRTIIHGSYFDSTLPLESVSLVVTSPPYLNNYHYARNTRPHLYWLGLLDSPDAPRRYERASFGKFWQTVRQERPIGLTAPLPELQWLLERLRGLSADRGPYGGPGWANYAATYFNDCWRLLAILKPQLQPGARAAIVVGNSIIQGLEFKVDQLLAAMAEQAGWRVERVRETRTKRVGNSIVNSAVRNGAPVNGAATRLYDATVVLKKP